MIHAFSEDEDEINEEDIMDDEDATLADDLLDEVGDEEDEIDPSLEGFGILPEAETKDEDEEEKDEDEISDEESLEEDAEEVDYDRFDDVDEM